MVVLNKDSALESQDGRSATCIGWGATNKGASDYPATLQTVDLDLLNSKTCSQLHQAAGNHTVKKFEFCAKGKKKDSCFGDSGGPLYETYMSGGSMYYLITGIVSWGGNKCAVKD